MVEEVPDKEPQCVGGSLHEETGACEPTSYMEVDKHYEEGIRNTRTYF